MNGLLHPADLFKVRLRPATGINGGWWACYVIDCAPAPDGCRQFLAPYFEGAHGPTPRDAYFNLTRGEA